MILFVLFSFTLVQGNSWENLNDYYLNLGINETCQEQSTTFKAIQTGATYQMTFMSNVQEGFSEVIYTFNLYYLKAESFIFQENSNIFFSEGVGDVSENAFIFCNSLYEVLYVKLHTNGLSNSNSLIFTITSVTVNPFLLTNVKIYVQKCSSNCLKCSKINTCLECNFDFQINKHGICVCPYHKPFLHLNNCVSQCPTGFSPFLTECKAYSTLNILLFDNLAEKFELFTDYNTTQRKAQSSIDGKIQAGPFYQNEAIKYVLQEQITSLTDVYLEFETFIFSPKSHYFLSVYFDENLILQKFFSKESQYADLQGNLVNICPSWHNSKSCYRNKYLLNFENITSLKSITIQWHLPLNDSEIYWTLNYIKFQQVQYQLSHICAKKHYLNQCLEQCPATTIEINSNCQSITNLYEFAEVAIKNYTTYLEDIYTKIFYQNQYYNTLMFNQLYQNRYIFGGHKVWDSKQYINQYALEKPHYKIKIYMKILLIDAINSQDSFYLKVEDKQYYFSNIHTLAKCFSNIGSVNCVKGENIGTNLNDYLIEFEMEYQHANNLVTITTRCQKNSNDFYCAYFDFVILVALCPLNCSKCSHSNNCQESVENNNQLQIFFQCPEEGYYKFEGSCQKCQNFCKVCVDSLSCVTCKDNYEMRGDKCICLYNRVNAEYTDCQTKCDKSCSLCQRQKHRKQNSIKFCSFCDIQEKKILNLNLCVCIDGYYMEENKQSSKCYSCGLQCKTCKNANYCLSCHSDQNRVLENNQCICKTGYYEFINTQLICSQCISTCQTCLKSVDLCTSCFSSQFRTLSQQNTCVCQIGYYEDQNQNCQKCNQLCENCENLYQCLTCYINQFRTLLNKNCECQEGYYEDQNKQCLECYYTCSKCNNSNKYNQCTLCPSTRIKSSNFQDQFECKCKIGYYDDFYLNCLSCLDYIDPPSNHYCYSKCGDLIIQWNEECDDGNLEQRDDCNQCYFPNSSCGNQYCQQCQFKQCIQCQDGYYLDSQNQCVQCSSSCIKCEKQKDNCTQCKYLNQEINQCLLCFEDLGYLEINNQCLPVCGDGIKTNNENCDDGNIINGDGCDQYCQIEQGYQCEVECQKINYIQILLSESLQDQLYSSKRHISFTFNQLVKFQSQQKIKDLLLVKPVQNNFEMQNLEIIDITDYSKALKQIFIEIQFDLNQSYVKPDIQIQLFNSSLFSNQEGAPIYQTFASITILDYFQPSDFLITSTKTAITFNLYVLYILFGLAISTFIFGGLEILWNLLDTLQLICYLKYFNVTYPYNLSFYFKLFSFGEFDFIKNQFDVPALFKLQIDSQQPPEKFYYEGYDTLFIRNIISIIIIFGMQFLILLFLTMTNYILQYLLQKLLQNNITKNSLYDFLLQYLIKFAIVILKKQQLFLLGFKNILLRTYFASAYDLNVVIFLQFQSTAMNSQLQQFSIACSIVCFILQIILIKKGFAVMNNQKEYFQKLKSKYDFQAFYEGINLKKGKLNHFFNLILLIKKIIFAGVLIFLYDSPIFQILVSSFLSLSLAIFLLIKKSLLDRNELYKLLSGEFILSLTQSTILIFAFSNDGQIPISQSTKDGVGFFIIALLSLLLLLQLVIDFKQHFHTLKSEYKIFQKILNAFQANEKQNKNQQQPILLHHNNSRRIVVFELN